MRFSLAIAAASLIAAPVAAQEDGAPTLVLRDLLARVTIETADVADFEVDVSASALSAARHVSLSMAWATCFAGCAHRFASLYSAVLDTDLGLRRQRCI